METTVRQKTEKRFSYIPPFFLILSESKYALMEDLKPYPSKEECKQKINELKNENEFDKYRSVKHQGRYFVYKRH